MRFPKGKYQIDLDLDEDYFSITPLGEHLGPGRISRRDHPISQQVTLEITRGLCLPVTLEILDSPDGTEEYVCIWR